MVEYKRAVEEFPSSCSMEEINIGRLHFQNGEKIFTSGEDLTAGNSVGIRFVSTGMYRNVSRGIGGVDFIYSVLLIGLHLLTLITGFPKSTLGGRNATSASAPSAAVANHGVQPAQIFQDRSNKEYARQETIAVVIWVGVFAVCILQVLVAAALYTGTKKRDGKICVRNCRIWCFTSLFLIIVIIFQLLGIFIVGNYEDHMVAVCVYFAELIFRTIAIIFIQSFIKELQAEMNDVENGEHVLYYQLCPTPSPKHPGSNNNTVSV